jgi:3-oxoacyl-[acyl-carrier protein] reductase
MTHIDLADQFAIVTGGARGIGHAIAERLLASGAACMLWDRDGGELAKAKTALAPRGQVHTHVVNIADPDAVAAAASATFALTEKVDILVNNAGIAGPSKPMWECTPAAWMEVLQINLFGVFLGCRAIVPHMIANGYGRIVNVASIAGKEGNPMASHYSAAKAGVIGLTKSLGKELAEKGVLVNAIAPAVIETPILEQITPEHIAYMRTRIPMNRFGRVEEAAALVAWLASRECSFSTGAVYDLSGGRATY